MELSDRGAAIARTLQGAFLAIREHAKDRPDEAEQLYRLVAATLRATNPMALSQVPDPILVTGDLER